MSFEADAARIVGGFAGDVQETIARTGARVRSGFPWWLRPFVARDVAGITLGRRIYLHPRTAAQTLPEVEQLVRHELVHVRQVLRFGLLPFLTRYVVEYIRNRSRGMDKRDAYRNISFELEAFAEETRGEKSPGG